MGTVDGKYSSPPSVSPAAPNFNVVVLRGGALGAATSQIALALNIEIGAQGGGAASGGGRIFSVYRWSLWFRRQAHVLFWLPRSHREGAQSIRVGRQRRARQSAATSICLHACVHAPMRAACRWIAPYSLLGSQGHGGAQVARARRCPG